MKHKFTRRFVSVVMVLIMIFGVAVVQSSAAEPVQLFTISDAKTTQGQEFEVTIKFAKSISPKNDPIAALDVSLIYDASVYTVIDTVKGAGLNKALALLDSSTELSLDKGDYVYSCSTRTSGAVKWCMATFNGFTFIKDEDFMTVRFKANDGSNLEGDISLKVEVTNAAGPDFSNKTANYAVASNNMTISPNMSTLCSWTYIPVTKTYTLKKLNDSKAVTFSIPDSYNDPGNNYGNLPVTAIASGAFKDNAKLETISIGRNVKTVGSAAFFSCKNLKKATIYSTDIKLGANAFYGAGDDFVIKCIKGSTADEYAQKNNIKVEYFEDIINCARTGDDEVFYYNGADAEFSNLKIFNAAGEELVRGQDYTIAYSDNIEIGEAKAVITGRNDYMGSVEIKFDILCPYHQEGNTYYTETKFFADCAEGGKVIKHCTFCGYHDESDALEAKEHVTTGEWETVRDVSCAQDGLEAVICQDCGKHIEEKVIDKLPHAHTHWETLEPTQCLVAGLDVLVCEDCGEIVERKPIAAPSHTPENDWRIIKAPTCSQEGLKVLMCTTCGEVIESEAIAKLPHTDAEEWITTKEATCEEAGEKALMCTVCGEVSKTQNIPALGHKAKEEWTVTKAVTCLDDGEEVLLCDTCGTVLDKHTVTATGHKRSEQMVVVKEPTCQEKGEKAIVCEYCSEIYEHEEIDVVPHAYEWVLTKPATCEEAGEKQLTCKYCGDVINTVVLPAAGHAQPGKWITTKNPTCTEQGEKICVCPVCEEYVFETLATPAKGHVTRDSEWITEKEPTCTEDGVKHIYCQICGQQAGEKILPALGHKAESKWTLVKEATCTEDGLEAQKCTVCSENVNTRAIKALGHIEGNWETVLEPDCTHNGLKQKVCKRCDVAYESQEITALGHEPEAHIVSYPSYKVTGLEKLYCSVCGEDLHREIVLSKVNPDVDGNGRLSSSDALLILQYTTGLKTLTDTQKNKADPSGDGRINSTDALIVLQLVTGILSA